MSRLDQIVQSLGVSAKHNVERARSIIGTPGPGFDLQVEPTRPPSRFWVVTGLTETGRRFLQHCGKTSWYDSRELARLKLLAFEFGLTFENKWDEAEPLSEQT